LINPDNFNNKLVDYLIFYNLDRVRCVFKNKLSPKKVEVEHRQTSTNPRRVHCTFKNKFLLYNS